MESDCERAIRLLGKSHFGKALFTTWNQRAFWLGTKIPISLPLTNVLGTLKNRLIK